MDELRELSDDDLNHVGGGYAGPRPAHCKYCGDSRLLKVKRFDPETAQLAEEWWECELCNRRQDW